MRNHFETGGLRGFLAIFMMLVSVMLLAGYSTVAMASVTTMDEIVIADLSPPGHVEQSKIYNMAVINIESPDRTEVIEIDQAVFKHCDDLISADFENVHPHNSIPVSRHWIGIVKSPSYHMLT